MRSRVSSLGFRSPGFALAKLGLARLGSLRLGPLRLGAVNLALLSLYFIPVWGRDAVRALISPYNGLEDRAHAVAAGYFGQLLDVGFGGVVLASHILAGIKLVIAAAFLSYAIEFARSWAVRREVDRETIDVVLILAAANIVIYALPALALGDAALIRLYATQMLLLAVAVAIIVAERHLAPDTASQRAATPAGETDTPPLALPVGVLAAGPPPPQATAAMARIPESRMRIQ
jgi:hypothetical protein